MYYIFVILILVIIYSQYKYVNKEVPTEFEIIEYNNPDKEGFEESIKHNQPCVFTNVLDNIVLTKKNIKEYFDYYLPDLNLTKEYEILQNKTKEETKILRQANYRFILYQIKGSQKIVLIPPTEKKKLYLDKTGKFSNVNFWKFNPNVYPKFNDISYMEIILRPRQMVYIPYNWWYTIKTDSNSNALICKSETVFSKFLKKK